MWELLDNTENADTSLEVGDFGVEFGCICLYFLNSLMEEDLCEGLGFNWVSKDTDSSGNSDWHVVFVDGEGVDGFSD